MSVDQETAAAPAESTQRSWFARRHWKAISAFVIVLALVVAGCLALRWWTHPQLLSQVNSVGTQSTGSEPLAKSQTTVGVTFPAPKNPTTVTFRSTPYATFADNTAHATTVISICHPNPNVPDNTAIGTVRGLGRHMCRSLEPIGSGTHFTLGKRDYIVATITPTTPGRVVITGMDFNYAMGRADWYRRGDEHLDMHLTLKRVY